MRWLRIASITVTALSLAILAVGQAKPNVVLITIDTLRADYLGCYGNRRVETPNLDALAAAGTLFERAYCQAPMTPPSHAAILTGTYPSTNGVLDFTSNGLRPGFPTLASLLKKAGYQTAAFVSSYVLESGWGLDQGFDLYYDHFDLTSFQGVNPGSVQRKAGETIDLVVDWLGRQAQSPYFLWVHLYDPHHDYNPPEPFHSKYSSDLYGGEVAYTDHELGRFFGTLKRRGEYDSSLIVVVSDHGEALGEHSEYEHGFFLYQPTLKIPLIIKPPKTADVSLRRFKDNVASVDIAPTILQLAQVSGDRQIPMQGRGLLGPMLGRPGAAASMPYAETLYPRSTFGWSDLTAWVEGRFKYIEAPRPELYDLEADPQEKANLYDRQRALADGLRQKLGQFRQRITASTAAAPSGADPAKVEGLRALGYLAVAVEVKPGLGRTGLADPKDKVHLFNKVLLAMQASDAGAMAKSSALLEEVIREEPDLFIAHYSLGVNELKSGRYLKALQQFEKADSLKPSFELTEINRATALSRLGRVDEAVSVLRGLLKENPARLEPRRQLGLLYTWQGKYEQAVSIYKEILGERPADVLATKYLGIALVYAGRYEEGLAELHQALRLGVNDALTYNSLGKAQANLGKAQEAIASYRRALSIKEDYHQARLNLSFALLKVGQKVEARTEFDRLCRENAALCQQYRSYFLK